MKTAGLSQENIQKIRELFPNAVTEVKKDGKIQLAVDFDVLRQDLSDSLIDVGQERYQMTWPGKRESVVLANSSTTDTLRPCREESVDFDYTQNLYIEGDNLTVLKLLRETYLGKVKMIYIDPPYNTGNDFIYKDDFAVESEAWREQSGEYDEAGNRLVKNPESNGRYHSDWLSMMYPRLRLARDLLTDDGVIFISIDDNEQANLKKICDEVFGESNFIAQIVWEKVHTRKNSAVNFSVSHDYIICYAKLSRKAAEDINGFHRNLLPRENTDAYKNPDNDPYGDWKLDPIYANNPYDADYTITKPNGVVLTRPEGRYWRYSKATIDQAIKDGRIVWGEGKSYPMIKRYLSEVANGLVPVTLFTREFAGDNMKGSSELDDLFCGKKIFSYPKPSLLIKRLLQIGSNKDSTILDFFSGSATTAHAVMQLNAEDGGNRKFIMVQLPEPCDEKSEAYKAGYKNICEIGKERIRRAGKKIVEEMSHLSAAVKSGNFQAGKAFAQFTNSESAIAEQESYKKTLDIGFRVLKLDSSNMQDVYYNPHKLTQTLLETTIDNIKPDRTPLDLLFQVMLELGVPLSAKIEEKQVGDKTYYAVNGNDLIACFDNDIDEDVITAIAKEQPLYAAFKDKSFATDSVAINNEQLFKTYSPITKIKVV